MKKKLLVIAALITLFTGCSENLQVNEPQVNTTTGPNWITLPKRNGSSVETEYSVTKQINGIAGGKIELEEHYFAGPFGEVKLKVKLDFPANCFSYTETITMIVDNVNGTVTYAPHMNFDKPAKLDLEIEGLDLTGINPDSIEFVYHNPDGYYDTMGNKKIKVRFEDGEIKLEDGKVPHFSRYGFSR